MNPDELLPLANETLWLLLALQQGPAHGYALMRDVEQRSDGRVHIQTGALYRILHRMERDGLIREAAAPASETDPRRRYYRVTPFGRRVAAAELERMRDLVASGIEAGVLRPGRARA